MNKGIRLIKEKAKLMRRKAKDKNYDTRRKRNWRVVIHQREN